MRVGASFISSVANTSTSTGWPERVVLVLAGLLVLAAIGWVYWRNRHPGAAGPRPLPTSPQDLGDALAGPFKGRYLATTVGGDPDLVVSDLGLGGPAAASIAVTDRGVFIERDGSELLYIPVESLSGVAVDKATGGTAFGLGALLVIGWKHGRERWQTGFRAISVRRHDELAAAIEAVRTGAPAPVAVDAPVPTTEVPL